MGAGLILPVMPEFLRTVLDTSLAQAALWGGLLSASFAAMQGLFAPGLGALSDRVGRRPVLLVSLAVVTADYVVTGLAWTLGVLFAVRLAAGLAASTRATAGAALADITPKDRRAADFGLMGVAVGLGAVLGPLIGGLLGALGPRAPFYAAALLAAASLTAGLRAMPETVSARTRRTARWRNANPFRALRRLPGLRRLIVLSLLNEVAGTVYPAAWAYYAVSRYGWQVSTIGLSLALYGAGVMLTRGLLVRSALAWFGERRTAVAGLAAGGCVALVLGSLPDGGAALVLIPFAALGALAAPAVREMMWRRTGPRRRRGVEDVLTALRSLAAIAAPVVMTGLFTWFTYDDTGLYLPGAPLYLAAALWLICLGLLLRTPPEAT